MRRGLLLSALTALIIASSLAVVPAHAAFPGQNGRIAYVATAGDHRAIYTVDTQGLDPRPLIDLGSGRDAINLAWSWDGQRIAFAGQTSPGGTFAIYVANADGSGSPRQVTTPVVSDTDPTWEPNGRQIAFTRRLDGDASVIAIVALSTEAVVSSWSGLGMSMEPSWSPDGRSIAFATKDPRTSCYPIDCRFQIWKLSLDGNTFVPAGLDFANDLHDPDWSPDGTLLVARFGRDEDPPYGPSGIWLYNLASGEPRNYLRPCDIIMTEPSFSPDGQYILATATPVSLTGEFGEPNLCAIRTDNSDAILLGGSPPRSDAAWGPVPGSPPAPPDTLPPTIEFRPDPSASEWLDPSSAGYIEMIATDDRSLPSLACTNDNSPMKLVINQIGSTTKGVAKLPEGSNHLVCTATDEVGNSTTALATYRVDLTPPSIVGPIVTPSVVRVGENVSASASVSDAVSRLQSADFEVVGTGSDSLGGGPMSGPGWSFSASFVPPRPDLWRVVVSARDRAGWVTESAVPFVAYDPLAGSTDGSGWIVPGRPTSDTGDVLPGLDGVRKASFSFTAMYKMASSETPVGNLTFSYGSQFKLQSKSLSWLAVRDAHISYLGGLASIQGMDWEFPFVAVIVDGAGTASPDRFELRVYEPGTIISSPTPLFSASGDIGGQIQIKR